MPAQFGADAAQLAAHASAVAPAPLTTEECKMLSDDALAHQASALRMHADRSATASGALVARNDLTAVETEIARRTSHAPIPTTRGEGIGSRASDESSGANFGDRLGQMAANIQHTKDQADLTVIHNLGGGGEAPDPAAVREAMLLHGAASAFHRRA